MSAREAAFFEPSELRSYGAAMRSTTRTMACRRAGARPASAWPVPAGRRGRWPADCPEAPRPGCPRSRLRRPALLSRRRTLRAWEGDGGFGQLGVAAFEPEPVGEPDCRRIVLVVIGERSGVFAQGWRGRTARSPSFRRSARCGRRRRAFPCCRSSCRSAPCLCLRLPRSGRPGRRRYRASANSAAAARRIRSSCRPGHVARGHGRRARTAPPSSCPAMVSRCGVMVGSTRGQSR